MLVTRTSAVSAYVPLFPENKFSGLLIIKLVVFRLPPSPLECPLIRGYEPFFHTTSVSDSETSRPNSSNAKSMTTVTP